MIKLVLAGAADAFLYKEAIKYLSDVVICGVVDSNIEEESLRLIALHQPVASDMRTLGAILKIITYYY